MQKYKKMDTKEVQSKKEKKRRGKRKDNTCSRKNILQERNIFQRV